MASAPPLPKNVFVRPDGAICAIFSARSATGFAWYRYDAQCTSLSICALAAAITRGLLWPALTTEIPEKQSRYSRPFSSQTCAPLAWSITIGATDFIKHTIPEISMVGQTEEQLTHEKVPYEVGL